MRKRLWKTLVNILLFPVFQGLADVATGEPPSVAQVQKDFKSVMEELNLRVQELRELQTEIEQDKVEFGEQMGGTNAQLEGLEAQITELQAEQRKLNEDFHAPRLTGEEVRQAETDDQLKAFFKFMRFAASEGGTEPLTEEERVALYPDNERGYSFIFEKDSPASRVKPEQARALVENTTGQILVPESFDTSIIRSVEEGALVRPRAYVRTIRSDREKYRKLTEFSVDCGEALELGGSVTESDITPSREWQYIENWYGLCYFGVNELMDADIELLAHMKDSFARARREKEDYYYLANGAGHASHQPEKLVDDSTITAIEAAAAGTICFEDLIDLQKGYEDSSSTPLKDVYRRAGVYFMHPFTELAVMKLRGDGGGGAGTGNFMWQPAVTAGKPNTIWGLPVYTSTNMAQIEASANSVWFGDVRSCYRILDRIGMQMQRLIEIKALAGLVGFLFTFRNTGGIIRSEAARILQHPSE